MSTPHVNPLSQWRLLIKGMGGAGDHGGKNLLTFNAPTDLWTRTNTGIISYDYDIANLQGAGTGGPYWVNPIVVPYDPVHQTGGSFWELKEGPHPGYLVSFHSNSLGYGDITVTQDANFDRGPGATLATIDGPHLCGASTNYNTGGEFHFTMLVDDPNVRIPYPKQTHYAIEFKDADTGDWTEVFAGMIWDMDATETEVVYYGIDYLALFQFVVDERFDFKTPKKAAPTGCHYADKTIKYVVDDLLNYALGQQDSLVGWIAKGTVEAMDETITIDTGMSQILPFIGGLIDSHRGGSGKYTRISVDKTLTGGYEVNVWENPGVRRNNLLLEYGDMITGYRAIPFGANWASRVNLVVQTLDGAKTAIYPDSSAIDQSVYGRIAQAPVFIQTMDKNDGKRRAKQAAVDAAALGRQISIGPRLGSLRPWEGYDLLDDLPIGIHHGGIDTSNWGNDVFGADPSGDPSAVGASYWKVIGLTWESYDDGHWITNPVLWPVQSDQSDPTVVLTSPIIPRSGSSSGSGSPPPSNPDNAGTYTDVTTGQQYVYNDDTESWDPVPGTATFYHQVVVGFDGGGSDIVAGKEQDVTIQLGGTIQSATMLADAAGDAVVDIWSDTYGNFPPTVADTICASAKPTLSAAAKSTDATLTGWDTTLTSGDILRFHLDSASGIKRLLVVLVYV